jgi:hypothetical protein
MATLAPPKKLRAPPLVPLKKAVSPSSGDATPERVIRIAKDLVLDVEVTYGRPLNLGNLPPSAQPVLRNLQRVHQELTLLAYVHVATDTNIYYSTPLGLVNRELESLGFDGFCASKDGITSDTALDDERCFRGQVVNLLLGEQKYR